MIINLKTADVVKNTVEDYRQSLEDDFSDRCYDGPDSPGYPTLEEQENFPTWVDERCQELEDCLNLYFKYGEQIKLNCNLADRSMTVLKVRE